MPSPARWALVLTGCAAALTATPAAASTLRLAPFDDVQMVLFEAADGETNSVSAYIGQDTVQIQDGFAGGTLVITPTPPCVPLLPGQPTPPEPAFMAECPKTDVAFIAAFLGDREDRFGGMIYTLPVVVFGGPGADTVYGGSLDDLLLGDDGADLLTGGQGNDILDGGPGPDQLTGDYTGATPALGGFDLADYSDRTAAVNVSLNGRTDDGEAGEGDLVARDIEDVQGGAGNDVITGNEFANSLDGGAGNDTIDGGTGADTIMGGDGDDTLLARDGAVDEVQCGAGHDTVTADANDTLAPDCEPPPAPPAPAPPTPAPAPPADRTGPALTLAPLKALTAAAFSRRGVKVPVRCSEGCEVTVELRITRRLARQLGLPARNATLVIGRASASRLTAGALSVLARPSARARKALLKLRRGRVTIAVTAKDAAGNASSSATTLTLRPR